MTGFTRREILALMAFAPMASEAALGTSAMVDPLQQRLQADIWRRPRTLNLTRSETGEQRRLAFWEDGKYNIDAVVAISVLMRDVKDDKISAISPDLLNAMYGMSAWLAAYNAPNQINVTSGFRSLSTNRKTEGAARDSAHTRGEAVDFTVPGVKTEYVARLAAYMQAGGVGYYPAKNFVHVEVGDVRTWVSRRK